MSAAKTLVGYTAAERAERQGSPSSSALLLSCVPAPLSSGSMICILVGLPARGKTYVSHKLSRYLSWLGYCARCFNVGEYRRKRFGSEVQHDFFDPANPAGKEMRKLAAQDALDDLLHWLIHDDGGDGQAAQASSSEPSGREENHGKVAIYDATNSTRERRSWLVEAILRAGISASHILFIELICDDAEIIASNILQVKLSSPDYVRCKTALDPESAIRDFTKRIQHYQSSYETIREGEWGAVLAKMHAGKGSDKMRLAIAYIKSINVGSRMNVRHCQQYWQTRIAYYLMNLHITPRSIYLCRHGESQLNVEGKIGGDSDLSEHGWAFAKALPGWIAEHFGIDKTLTVWTSTLKRTIQTAQFLDFPKLAWKALDEIYAGKCDGLSYSEIAQLYPADLEARDRDKFHYRYPEGGESYGDLVLRLSPMMMELERQTNVLLIGHQAVLRAIYAYFAGLDRLALPYVKIPLHTILELRPMAYGCQVIRHAIGIPAVDTHRDKPASSYPQ